MGNQELRERFQRLKKQWKDETGHWSMMSCIVSNPAYQEIIEMGNDALPFIFEELERDPDWWFHALHMITKTIPSREGIEEDEWLGVVKLDLEKLTEVWLKWWKDNKENYVKE